MNVLVTSTSFIPSVLLCGHSQLDYLEKEGLLKYRFVIAHFINKQDIEWANIIIFLRSDSDLEAYISKIAKKQGVHSIYVLDDDLLNAPSYVSSFSYYNLSSTKHNIMNIMNNCDTFLTPSPVLLEKYGTNFKNKFLIAEPSLNRINEKRMNRKIKIGFAGSIDRAEDLDIVLKDTITRIVDKYKDTIDIVFLGAKPNFVDELQIKHIPYQDDYSSYTACMASENIDIGLAPMPKTSFHECKYFNKYIEYSSFGIAGIYSNLKPYIYGVRNKENGLLVNNNTEEWYEAIVKLIEDDKLRSKISRNSLIEANNIYALNIVAKDYLNKISVGYKEANIKINNIEIIKFIILIKRIYRKIIEQGLNFPIWFVKKIEKKIKDSRVKQKYLLSKKKLYELIKKKNSVCIFSTYFNDTLNGCCGLMKMVDDGLKDKLHIYLNGEDRLCEDLKVEFIDSNHVTVVFNSFDILQTNEILKIIEITKNCIIQSIEKFDKEKLSNEMFKIFDINDINIIWVTDTCIPESYHLKNNFHMENITNSIEKIFYMKSKYIVSNNDDVLENMQRKYLNKSNIKYIKYKNEDDDSINNILV